MKLIEKQGIPMLEVSLITRTGIAGACYSTRLGGVSQGSVASMNLNIFKAVGDPNHKRNFDMFCGAIGVAPGKLVANHEVHGNVVRMVDGSSVKSDIFDTTAYEQADGLVTDSRDICLFVYASDCAILFFLDSKNRAIGACHAGWKGAANGLVPNTVEAMAREFGSDPKDILASVSPCIHGCCSVMPFGDLDGTIKRAMISAGLREENIAVADYCTKCRVDLFHSHDRENGRLGKYGANGGFLWLK